MKLKPMLRNHRRLMVTGAAALTALLAGTAYAATTSVSTSRTDTVVSSSSGINLANAGGTTTPIVTFQFPASTSGTHYVLSAHGDLVNFGPSDYTRCNLVVNGTQVAAVSTIVGDPSASGSQGPAAYLSPFSLTGGANVSASGGTGALQCWHDNSNGATPYVDGGATVWAHKTVGLKIGTE